MRVAKDLFVCGFKVACVVAVCYGLVVVYMAKEADMGFRGGGLDAFEVADVVGVHSEDDVKGEKVVARDGARGVVEVDRDVASLAKLRGSFVRFFACMVGSRTARVEDAKM